MHIEDRVVIKDKMQLENYVLEHVYHGSNDHETSQEESGIDYYEPKNWRT